MFTKKQQRLAQIFAEVNTLPSCSNMKDVFKQISTVFKRVEDAAELERIQNGFDFVSDEKMICSPDLIPSKDFKGHKFVEQKNHILIVAPNGAYAVYGLIQEEGVMTARYVDETPEYCKVGKSGLDVFGRKPSS